MFRYLPDGETEECASLAVHQDTQEDGTEVFTYLVDDAEVDQDTFAAEFEELVGAGFCLWRTGFRLRSGPAENERGPSVIDRWAAFCLLDLPVERVQNTVSELEERFQRAVLEGGLEGDHGLKHLETLQLTQHLTHQLAADRSPGAVLHQGHRAVLQAKGLMSWRKVAMAG